MLAFFIWSKRGVEMNEKDSDHLSSINLMIMKEIEINDRNTQKKCTGLRKHSCSVFIIFM